MSILGSSANCNQGSQNANALTNKYCGSILNPTAGATVNVPICGKIFDDELALEVFTPSIPEIIWVKNVGAIVVCGIFMK